MRSIAAVLFLAGAAFGQEAPVPPAPPDSGGAAAPATAPPAAPRAWQAPEGSLVVNLPSDQALSRGLLQFLVTHRFLGAVRGSNAHSLYSVDSGAVFGFGFAYAPLERTEVSLYRSATQDDWELAAKYAFIPSGRLFGAALRVGGDDRRAPIVITPSGGQLDDTKARTSFFAQGIFGAHLMNNRIELSVVPTYSSRTTSEHNAFNVPFHAAVALGRTWNFQAEYQFQRTRVPDSIDIWAIGIEKTLYRHRFSLVVSNSTATNVDQYLSGDVAVAFKRQQRSFDNGFRNNDWHIGFNLIRQFKP